MAVLGHTFVIRLDYGDRAGERKFVGDVLDTFDKDILCGANLFINNDPYSFELLLALNFEKDGDSFEKWLKENYPSKTREYRLLFGDMTEAVSKKGFSFCGLLGSDTLDFDMPSHVNRLFLFPDRKVVSSIWGRPTAPSSFTVFLSHSSRDKHLVDEVFNELHKAEVRAWYDRYEIEPGDSITEKINAGLTSSRFGFLFFSKNFLDARSGWPKAEGNYFFQKLMREGQKNFVILNVDLTVDKLPPLLQDRRFIDMKSPTAMTEIVELARKQSAL